MNAPQPTPENPWCVAHRGDSANCPENTPAAIDAALAAPIDAIETDIQMTRDGVPVIYHDKTLHLIGQGRRTLRRVNLDELQSFDFGGWYGPDFAGQRLMTLDELLTRHGQTTRWLLEIKVRDRDLQRLRTLMNKVIDAIRNHGIDQSAWILCFDLDLLRYGHGLAPDLRYVLNQHKAKLIEDDAFLAAYSVNIGGINPDFCATVQQRGKPVWTYTVNRPSDLNRARRCRVNAIMSDNPTWLAQQLTQPATAN